MQGAHLTFYLMESRKHHTLPLYEWLLEQAKKMGIHGGTAFRACEGYGRHGVLHRVQWSDLHGGLPIKVEFIVRDDEAERLLKLLETEKISLFYERMPAEFGLLNENATAHPVSLLQRLEQHLRRRPHADEKQLGP